MSEYIYGTDGHQEHWLTGEEIVRCGACMYYYEAEEYNPHFNYIRRCCEYFGTYNDEVAPDGFCKWGEPKAAKNVAKVANIATTKTN